MVADVWFVMLATVDVFIEMATTDRATMMILFVFCLIFAFGEATNCKGCIQLDSYSFDKLTSKFDATIVKFDVAYPYGEKHEEYCKASESLRDVQQLLVAEVGVKDYGEKDNTDLAERYGVSKDDYPTLKLFKLGEAPVTFTGDFKADNILNFIRVHSKVYVGLPGCLEDFDKLAMNFVASNSEDGKKKILRQTEDLWDSAKGVSNQKSAEVYVKTMRRSLEKEGFVDSEIKRIENILKGKLSKEKSSEMQVRLNVLKSFVIGQARKDEL